VRKTIYTTAFYDATLARRIAPLEEYDDPLAGAFHMLLEAHQLHEQALLAVALLFACVRVGEGADR